MALETKKIRIAELYANAIFVKLLLLIGAYYGGSYLDSQFGTRPYLLLLCLSIALGLGFWWIIILANRASKS